MSNRGNFYGDSETELEPLKTTKRFINPETQTESYSTNMQQQNKEHVFKKLIFVLSINFFLIPNVLLMMLFICWLLYDSNHDPKYFFGFLIGMLGFCFDLMIMNKSIPDEILNRLSLKNFFKHLRKNWKTYFLRFLAFILFLYPFIDQNFIIELITRFK
ncbi:hypothetical protein EDEG_00158 [Edhazardia aedis USNM 41457]|uniref:Uncharacterized protein n=1 Tax=Edhazardia aedis (strain USNM 41457) TaxID=1003232 RepID=J9D8N4_EDHAE|nr:hypothetical protein EDEG_00158 [Edhazardia aedis USNM 41457]|eukprot:EJW04106.1 hypothetical protein EDEG_00158 [Edhazardia aedis USNM 41457]